MKKIISADVIDEDYLKKNLIKNKEQELQEKMDKFFEELGLSEGIENMNKFEEEIMIPEINRRLEKQREEFERLIDKEIKVGCGVKLENIILGNKRKLIPDTCGEKGFLCFDCKQRLELKEQLKNQLVNQKLARR